MSPRVWSEAALALFELRGPTAVSAGAGSGKTTALVELVLRLLSGEATGAPAEPSQLVAITFTDKAAAELDERLRAAVAERAAAAADPGEARAWRRRLHALDAMTVGTIHAFAGRLLRQHALEAGLDPGFTVADEETAQGWRRDAARAAVLAALDEGREEARALAAAHGVGGARRGLADLVVDVARARATLGDAAPVAPAPDLLAEALAARAALLAAADALRAARAEVRTASGGRALERLEDALAACAADRAGPLRPEALASLTAPRDALKGWRVGATDGERPKAAREALLEATDRFLPLAAEALAGPQKRELCRLVADAEARYAEAKRRAGALDFDDLLARARDLLRDRRGLLAELRAGLRALLVDEYQDVNPLQQELFALITEGEAAPLLVGVGDLKQSIYRFRGADVAVFRGLLDRFGAAPPARVLHLARNHRSTPEVLAVVNEVSARCMQPPGAAARPYELAFGEEDRLVALRPPAGLAALEVLDDGEGGKAAERRPREAAAVAARIEALVSGAAGVTVRERGADGVERERRPRLGDVAILFRRLTQVGEYERALRRAGLPYRLARGGGFYQAPEVRDVGELLASLSDPEDAVAWAALLRSPWCGVSDGALFALSRAGLATLARRSPEEAVAALLSVYPRAAGAWPAGESSEADRLRRFLGAWRELAAVVDRLPTGELLRRAAAALDVEAALLAGPDGERRVANLRKAVALAERHADRGGSAAGLAARLRRMASAPPREPEAELEPGDAVALLSVHQAKGLEWPVVFLPDLGAVAPRDGRRAFRSPSGALAASFYDPATELHHPTAGVLAAREEETRAAAAESRRLLYVALTRARDRLVLSGEVGKGSGETWRGLVEGSLAARPELAVRIPIAQAGTYAIAEAGERAASADGGRRAAAGAAAGGAASPAGASDAAGAASGTGAPRGAATSRPAAAAAGGAPLPPLRLAGPVPPTPVRLAVTALAEHARCPRRVHLLRHLGLPERGAPGGAGLDDPDRATARGTLAHAMLAEVDLGAPPLERRARLEAVARRRGYDPAARGVKRIVHDVLRFLASEAGGKLAEAARRGAVRREVPFLLCLEGDGVPACYLTGAVDAVVEARREIAVIDFKYAVARPGAAERYRLQLLAYAAAAERAHPGRRVTARLQFLRGACAAVDVTPSPADLRRFVREAPRLAAEVRGGAGLSRPPAELGRDEARCAGEGCGYLWKCYPRTGTSGTERAGAG